MGMKGRTGPNITGVMTLRRRVSMGRCFGLLRVWKGGEVLFLGLRAMSGPDLGPVLSVLMRYFRADAGEGDGTSPVSMADPKVIEVILSEAGFAEIGTTKVDVPQPWGRDAVDAAEFMLEWGP